LRATLSLQGRGKEVAAVAFGEQCGIVDGGEVVGAWFD
jgi:hypothetical protein